MKILTTLYSFYTRAWFYTILFAVSTGVTIYPFTVKGTYDVWIMRTVFLSAYLLMNYSNYQLERRRLRLRKRFKRQSAKLSNSFYDVDMMDEYNKELVKNSGPIPVSDKDFEKNSFTIKNVELEEKEDGINHHRHNLTLHDAIEGFMESRTGTPPPNFSKGYISSGIDPNHDEDAEM